MVISAITPRRTKVTMQNDNTVFNISIVIEKKAEKYIAKTIVNEFEESGEFDSRREALRDAKSIVNTQITEQYYRKTGDVE